MAVNVIFMKVIANTLFLWLLMSFLLEIYSAITANSLFHCPYPLRSRVDTSYISLKSITFMAWKFHCRWPIAVIKTPYVPSEMKAVAAFPAWVSYQSIAKGTAYPWMEMKAHCCYCNNFCITWYDEICGRPSVFVSSSGLSHLQTVPWCPCK